MFVPGDRYIFDKLDAIIWDMKNFNRGGGFGGDRGNSGFSRGGFGGGGGGNRGFGGPKEMFRAVCDECGRDCEVPFRPTGEKPVYCSSCFEKGGQAGQKPPQRMSQPTESYKEEFKQLQAKLDRLIDLLSPAKQVEAPKKEEPKETKAEEVKAEGTTPETKDDKKTEEKA